MADKGRDISHFNLIDWDFKEEDSKSYIHNFCWYPGRFIPIIPSFLIKALSKEGDTILDPYSGSGTTVLESIKLNRNAIGIDLNPVACFIAKIKVHALKKLPFDFDALNVFKDDLKGVLDEYSLSANADANLFYRGIKPVYENVDLNSIPNSNENKPWYHETTLKMLAYLFLKIRLVTDEKTKDLLTLFFISILIPSSGHENKKPYTYYADNVKPKCPIFKNAIHIYYHKMKKFLDEYKSHSTIADGSALIINEDIRNLRELSRDFGKVDLVLTSPPYLSVTDYTTAYRLVYLWDIFPPNLDNTKKLEIGARWRRRVQSSFNDYLDSITRSISDMSYVLKENGYLCLVLGEPKRHSEALNKAIESYAVDKLHLEYVDSFSRNVSKNFFLHPSGGVPTEDIMIFRRGRNVECQ